MDPEKNARNAQPFAASPPWAQPAYQARILFVGGRPRGRNFIWVVDTKTDVLVNRINLAPWLNPTPANHLKCVNPFEMTSRIAPISRFRLPKVYDSSNFI